MNNLVPFLEPVSQCKLIPRETCSFGVLNKLGGTPLVTKWCYDSDNKVISDQLKRRGKLTFDEGDNDGSYQLENTAAVKHNLRFSQIDVEDKAITKGRLLQDLQSVKNVPSQDLVDRNIIDQGEITSLYFDDSNSALENSRLDNNFAVENFNSFQEMINHEFHENIPASFHQVKAENDILTPSVEILTKTTANILENKEAEKSSSPRLKVIFPVIKEEGEEEEKEGSNKRDNDGHTPLGQQKTVTQLTNNSPLTGRPLLHTESPQLKGSTTGFLRQEETTIGSSEHSFQHDKQKEVFKARVNMFI